MGFDSSPRVLGASERGAPQVQARVAGCRNVASARLKPGRSALPSVKKEAISRDEQSSPRTAREAAIGGWVVAGSGYVMRCPAE